MAKSITEQQLLATLLHDPKLLLQSDKYQIESTDFSNTILRYIFWAIENLAPSSTGPLTPYEVEKWISNSPTGKALFESKGARQFLIDCDSTPVSSFDAIYMQFKRENLINDLSKNGYKVDNIYIPHPVTEEERKISEEYARSTPQDILEKIEKNFLNIKSKYLLQDTSQSQSIYTGLQDMIDNLYKTPEIGLPLQGDIFNYVVSGALLGKLYIRSGSSGLGKAIPNSTIIPTPTGYKTIAQIKKGDFIFDAHGKKTQVLGVYPQGEKEVYKIFFEDGRTTYCCKDHLWSFYYKENQKDRNFNTTTLQEIIEIKKTKEVFIPNNDPVYFEEKKYNISPYIMGLLLGGGIFDNNIQKNLLFITNNESIVSDIANFFNWKYSNIYNKKYLWCFFNKDNKIIKTYKILYKFQELKYLLNKTKYIPECYRNGSIKQRIDLLYGILKAKGVINTNNITYFSYNYKMISNIKEICYSLNIPITITKNKKKYSVIININVKKYKDLYDSLIKTSTETHNNKIIRIIKTQKIEKMTCFYVDNKEHLFLTNDFLVTHNTRSLMADACQLAFPIKFNWYKKRWENNGYNEKVLIIVTEQDIDEVQKMAVAYITGINESVIKRGLCNEEQKKIIQQAMIVFEQYKSNFFIVRVPNPSINLVTQLLREQVNLHNISYVFYDYIFISPSLLKEYKHSNLRNDEILLMFSDALKKIAVELDIFIMSSTQVNSNADSSDTIRNESSLAGSRAIITKADVGCIMARPLPKELEILTPIIKEERPNIVTDIYKVRGADYSQIRIWSYMNLGTLYKKDLFVTDALMKPINIDYKFFNYIKEPDMQINSLLTKLNIEKVIKK